MVERKGSDLRLVVNHPVSGWVTLDCATTDTTSLSNEQVDVTKKSDMHWRRLKECGSRSMTLTSDGIVQDLAILDWLNEQYIAGSIITAGVQRVDLATNELVGEYLCSTFERGGDHNDAEKYSLTLESAGGVSVPGGAVNQAPVAYAGVDQISYQPTAVTLDGSAVDDGLPVPPSLTYAWSKFSGPGTVVFVDSTDPKTDCTFSATGTYVLELEADDSALTDTDQMEIIVYAQNTAPVVNAGGDDTITLPADAVLSGSAVDDGLPVPPSLSYLWTKFSGPGTVTFDNDQSPSTIASFSTDGVYVLQLACDDTDLTGTDTVQITVNPVPASNNWITHGGDAMVTIGGDNLTFR